MKRRVAKPGCRHHLLMAYSRPEQLCNDMLALKGSAGIRGVSASLCYDIQHHPNARVHCLALASAVKTLHPASHCCIMDCVTAPHALCPPPSRYPGIPDDGIRG